MEVVRLATLLLFGRVGRWKEDVESSKELRRGHLCVLEMEVVCFVAGKEWWMERDGVGGNRHSSL